METQNSKPKAICSLNLGMFKSIAMFRSPELGLRAVRCARASGLSLTFSVPRTFSSTSTRSIGLGSRNQHHQYHFQKKRIWPQILAFTLGGLGLAGFSLWWFYWPHHTFTSSVAKILRKGLWAESSKGHNDYVTALKYYHEALQLAIKEELDPISDEYTGIQLKICEMYERLNMNNDALMLYSEIASSYLDALTTPEKLPNELRAHIIQKDLRVVIKMVELNKTDAHTSKVLLLTHFLIAQEEVSRRSSIGANLMNEEKEELFGENKNNSPELAFKNKVADGSMSVDKDNKVQILEKNKTAWEPFRDELFSARDLYVAICVATGDLTSAVRAKIATTSWMLNADCNPGEILMSQTNLGSLIYLQAEEYEVREHRAIKSKASEEEIQENRQGKKRCIQLATQCYDAVLQFSKKLPAQIRHESNVEESIALSTYGLGVINLHLGELDSAKNLLRESRLRAKGTGFSDLVNEAERELSRLQQEFEKIEAEGLNTKSADENDRIKALLNSAKQPDVQLDVQLVKNK